MLSLLTHILSLQVRAALLHQPHGVATGMGIDAMKKVFHLLILAGSLSENKHVKMY
jgi:hypothetical protein